MPNAYRLVIAACTAAALAVACSFALPWHGGAPGWLAAGHAKVVKSKDEPDAVARAAELLKPGPLPEIAIGKADAPVTIVEYADLTCPHCAAFNSEVLPRVKEKYIDTGKARLLFREFPLNTPSLIAFMSVRCVAPEAAHQLIATLFAHQEEWRASRSMQELAGNLFTFGEKAGLTRQAFDACVPGSDGPLTERQKQLVKDISEVRNRGNKVFGVEATPTFFVNGRKLSGASFEELDKAIGAALEHS